MLGLPFSGCSNSSTNDGAPDNSGGRPPYEKAENVFDSFAVPTAFHSETSKVKIDSSSGDVYGLIQLNDKKKTSSRLIKFSADSKLATEIARSSSQDIIMDFDVSAGEIVLLRSSISSFVNQDFEMPYRELKIQKLGLSAKSITFFDRNQPKSFIYNKNGDPRPVQLPDVEQTLFLVGHESIQFARLLILDSGILITTTGLAGEKAFLLNHDELSVIWDVVFNPRTDYRDEKLYAEAPLVTMDGGSISVASKVLREEIPIISRHLATDIPVEFNFRQGSLLQRLNISGKILDSKAYLSADYLSLTSLKAKNGNRFLLADIASPDGWKGSIVKVGNEGQVQWKTELSPYGESSFSDMVVGEGPIFVGGKCGFQQVTTGSVVTFADACLLTLNSDGKIIADRYFGTERNDGILSMDHLGDRLLMAGFIDGPITHTADQDENAGFQTAFLGWLK